ncbi:MAG: MFS transporter [Chthoniobacterales bacterium]
MPLPAVRSHDPYASLRQIGYRRYLTGAFCASIGRQMGSVAITWQIYKWTHSATALGLVGLLNVIPLLLLSLPAGSLADRSDRKTVVSLTTLGVSLLSILLAGVAYFHTHVPPLPLLNMANGALRHLAIAFEHNEALVDFSHPALPILYLILFFIAVLRILGWPSRSSIVPLLVPPELLSNAVTWNSSTFEIATMAGPAIGGFLIAWTDFSIVYLLDALCGITLVILLTRVHYLSNPPPSTATRSLRGMLAGAEFIWRKKVILGASSLDLFAVLLGGAVALLPIYADRILHVGPIGLGWLRAAPSIGAFSMALWIAHRRPMRRPGLMMLWAVGGFGIAIFIFGISKWFWLSFIALIATGIFDNVSVVVRQSLVQLLTPNHLRGRVTSVNQIFVGSSNEIGTLRAGLMAAVIGPVAAVLWGGVGTIAVVLLVAKFVPQLRSLPPLNQLKSEDEFDSKN